MIFTPEDFVEDEEELEEANGSFELLDAPPEGFGHRFWVRSA